ncbi:MAG: OmpA family protein [Verrucomicrobia bacterium]|nr:OmpA family protein [Verrucomicrobiota bacterium]
MKRVVFLLTVVIGTVLLTAGCLQGEKQARPTKMDSLGWWPTKAQLAPKADPRPTMDGEWWWATERGPETDPLWGNRGFVYVLRRTGQEQVPAGSEKVTLPRDLKAVEGLIFEDVYFEFDKSEITPAGKEVLDDVVAKLNEYPEAMVTMEGHTCSIGTEEYNMGLGQRRADAVRGYLVSQGIAPERLKTVSYGETRLKVQERTREDFARNRRVEFQVTMPEEIR